MSFAPHGSPSLQLSSLQTLHSDSSPYHLLRILLLLFFLGSFPVLGQTNQPDPNIIQIDPSKSYGAWEGWGTSLAWMGKVYGDRDDLADALFTTKTVTLNDEKLPGLGMTVIRYNAGACSWNEIDGRKMAVSKTILPFRQMEGFWLDGNDPNPSSSSWDWNVDSNQRAMLLKARDRGADRFELFSNSPMWWMCANDNPSGNGKADNLPEKNYPLFATYLATIAKYAKDHWSLAFTSVDPFNESVSSGWIANGRQEGCHFGAMEQAKFLPILRAELDRQGLKNLPVAASDENTFDLAISSWKSYPPEIRAIVQKINVHGYQGVRGNRDELYQLAVADGKKLWNSEHGEKFADGLEMARDLSLDLHSLHPTAWCYWQPVDSDLTGWGFFKGDLQKAVLEDTNPKYFVFAQYARHIRPGMTILEASDANTVVAYDAKAHKLVFVTFNDGPARSVSYDLSHFTVADGPMFHAVTEPKGTSRYAIDNDLALSGNRFSAHLPADSIQTFELSGITLP
jgi:galactan endo-1,6-beta-galactosidase